MNLVMNFFPVYRSFCIAPWWAFEAVGSMRVRSHVKCFHPSELVPLLLVVSRRPGGHGHAPM